MSIPWTAEQLTQVIAAALKAGDFEGVFHALRLLAIVDPARAQAVHDTIQLGIAMAAP